MEPQRPAVYRNAALPRRWDSDKFLRIATGAALTQCSDFHAIHFTAVYLGYGLHLSQRNLLTEMAFSICLITPFLYRDHVGSSSCTFLYHKLPTSPYHYIFPVKLLGTISISAVSKFSF